MNDLSLHGVLHQIEVRNGGAAHRLDGECQRLVRAVGGFGRSQPFSRRAQDAKHLRPIESLTFTVLAETHTEGYRNLGLSRSQIRFGERGSRTSNSRTGSA